MRKLLNNLRFVIIAVVAFTGVVSPLLAETWECVIEKSKHNAFMPTTVTYTVGQNTGAVTVKDDLSNSWGRSIVDGVILTDNPKRQTIKWQVDGIPTQRSKKYLNMAFNTVFFKISRFKSSSRAKVLSEPNTKYGRERTAEAANGSCTQIK